MLDTVRAVTKIYISWIDELPDWHTETVNGVLCKYKNVRVGKASVFLRYYYTQYLTITFSAAKVQHGNNATAYNYANSAVVEETIRNVLIDELYLDKDTRDFTVCRLDLNKDFVFDTRSKSDEAVEFFNKILPSAYERRFDYETGMTSQRKKGTGKRVYRKNQDPHIPKSIRNKMQDTVRMEYQLDKKRVEQYCGFIPTLHEMLTNHLLAEKVWNKLVAKDGLNGKILNYADLIKFAIKYLTKSEIIVLEQMNTAPCFNDKKLRQKQLAVIRKMKKLGVSPYSCETIIVIPADSRKTLLEIAHKEYKHYSVHTYSLTVFAPRNRAKYSRWFLDSS